MTRTMRCLAALTAAATAAAAFAGDGILPFGKKKEEAPPPEGVLSKKTIDTVAIVNGETITRDQLIQELIDTYGQEHLETMINRRVIEQAAKQRKVDVTRDEIEADLQATLTANRMSRKEFAEVLKKQHIGFGQHLRDTVYPKIAVCKMVKDSVKVSDDDVRKGFEATYGEKVEVRMLAVQEMRAAQEIWEKMMQIPAGEKRLAEFERVVMQRSVDEASRSTGGKISPINRHSSNPDIENAIFNLKDGELSSIMQIPNGNVMFLCVRHVPAQKDVSLDTKMGDGRMIKEHIKYGIYLKKLQFEVERFYLSTRNSAKIDNLLSGNFDPETLKKMATAPEKTTTK